MSEPVDRDPFNLERFIAAQQPVIEQVFAELHDGRKESHWMWFVFPQIAGLGRSETARKFAITSLEEAEAYLAHPVLGPRLRDCTALVLQSKGRSAADIFGSIDSLKFRSCMTLFTHCDTGSLFQEALETFFDGIPDAHTLQRLKTADDPEGRSRGRIIPRVSSVAGRQLIDTTRTSEVLDFLDQELPLEKRR